MTRPATPNPNHPASTPMPDKRWHARRNRPRNRPRERRTRSRARAFNRRPKQPPNETPRSHAEVSDAYAQVSPPGLIGGAVINAARRSAKLTRRQLARVLAVTPATVRGWENGTIPLFAAPYTQIRQLAGALDQPGTRSVPLLTELLIASQCDLLITRMLDGTEDYAEPPPLDVDTPDGAIARDLLRWAFYGVGPGHRAAALAGKLLASSDLARLACTACELMTGASGSDLPAYGAALLEIIVEVHEPASSTWPRRRQVAP